MSNNHNKYKIEIDSVNESEWSVLLKQFQDANIYQTWSYGKVAWRENNLSHLLIKDENNNIVCMAQLGITKVPIIKAGIATLYWGPLWRLRGREYDMNMFDFVIKVLRDEYSKKRHLNMRIYPYIYSNDVNINELHVNLLEQGFQHTQTPYKTLLINLKLSLDELRKGLVPRWRTDLNRSEKNDLEVIEGDSIELYDEFERIYEEMLANKQFLSFADPDMFRTIQQDLPGDIKIKTLISRYDGASVSAALTSHIGNTGLGIFWASNALGRKMNAAYQLQWKTMEILKTNGCLYYDIGGIDFETNPGSYRFKTGLAGKNGVEVQLIGKYDICDSMLSKILTEWGAKVKIYARNLKIFLHKIHKKDMQ